MKGNVNEHPGKLTIGQSRAMILGAQYMFDKAGIADKVVWVPYSSGADATADLLGGHLNVMVGTVVAFGLSYAITLLMQKIPILRQLV